LVAAPFCGSSAFFHSSGSFSSFGPGDQLPLEEKLLARAAFTFPFLLLPGTTGLLLVHTFSGTREVLAERLSGGAGFFFFPPPFLRLFLLSLEAIFPSTGNPSRREGFPYEASMIDGEEFFMFSFFISGGHFVFIVVPFGESEVPFAK